LTTLFDQHKKSITFSLPQEIGPFLVQQRVDFAKAEEMLNRFDFEKESSLVYDPHGVIVSRRSTYKHESRGMIEKKLT
jgi:hypothetical protein